MPNQFSSVYTAEQKVDGVKLVSEHGLAEARRLTGIPKQTLWRWCEEAGVKRPGAEPTRRASEAVAARHALLREQLRLQLLERAIEVLQRMDDPHTEFKGAKAEQVEYPIAPAASVQNYAVSAAVLIDKYRLEMGESTDRTETRDVTNDLDLKTRKRITAWLDRRLEPDTGGADGVPEVARSDVR